MNLLIGLVYGVIFWASLALGTDTARLADDPTLPDYLQHAVANNAGLRSAFSRWKAALEQVPQSKALPNPRFTYAFYVEEVETRVGPQRQKFGFSQTFPWFGTLADRKDAASQAAAAAEQTFKATERQLFYRVKHAFYDYWYLAQKIAVTEEHAQLVTNLERVALARFKTGAVPHSAVIQAQVERAKLDDRLRTLQALRGPIVARLNSELSRDGDLPLPWPRNLPELDTTFADDEVLQRLADGSPELRRLDHLVMKEAADADLAGKRYFPDITLGVDYVDTGDALSPGVVDSGKDPVIAMMSVSLPLWYGKQRAAKREAKLRQSAAADDRDDAGRRLEADLRLALYQLRDAERKLDLYRTSLIPKVKQSLSVARQGFETGRTSFMALIDAQRLLLEFQLAHRRAEADRGQRLAEVEMIAGVKLKLGKLKIETEKGEAK